MAKGSRGGKRGAGGGGSSPVAAAGGSNAPTNAQRLSDAQAQALRQQQDSSYDASTTAAVKMYISNTDFDSQGHSLSQTMNYALEQGIDLQSTDAATLSRQLGVRLTNNDLASLQYTDAYMARAVHSLGADMVLQRGAHDDLLSNTFGISDYSKMSQAQLQSKLVGQKFQTTSYMSTSYDVSKNPFLSSSSVNSGGREVVFNIKAGANTKGLFGAKAQSEVIIGKGTNFKITGVRYTGVTATPRGRSYKPQIELDIETY